MLVCLLFFNFAMLFDFGYYSLAQEMSFVDCYLPYFRQHLFTCRLSALLPFQSLFTESLHGDKLLAPPLFSDALEHPALSAVCLFGSLLITQFYFFCGVGVSLPRGLCCFISGVAVGILHATYLLNCWSALPKQVWSWCLVAREPSCFSV
jgi:hypothetical protein